jgi:small-conductance mechanosensitive channel
LDDLRARTVGSMNAEDSWNILGEVIQLDGKGISLFAVILGLCLLSFLIQRFVVGKATMASKSIGLIQILLLIVLLSLSEEIIVKWLSTYRIDKVLIIVKCLLYWYFVKSFLDVVYADLYLKRIKKKQVNPLTIDLLKFALLVIIIMGATKAFFNITFSSLLTSSAILTAVVGLSMQDSIGSLISGILIQLEKPFEPGDWIRFGAMNGKVISVSWRYTEIETIEQDYIFIPNNQISKETLYNYSRPIPQVRGEINIQLPLKIPPVRVKQILANVLEKASLVVSHPRPLIRIDQIRENLIEYVVLFYTRSYEDIRAARDELYASVWYELKMEGVELPYPVREVTISKKRDYVHDEKLIQMLKGIPMFGGLSDRNLALLVDISNIIEYGPQSRIVSEGATDSTFFVILEGKVSVRKGTQIIAELGFGEFFGEMALLTGEPRKADIISLENTRCLELDRQGFKRILENNKHIIDNIKESLRERVRQIEPNLSLQAQKIAQETFFQRFIKIFS